MAMSGIGSWCARAGLCLFSILLLKGCAQPSTDKTTRFEVNLAKNQNWQLQPGDAIAGYSISGGLGDISIVLKGNSIYAPYDGETHLDKRGCLYFETPDIPAYLFRFCGLHAHKIGKVSAKQAIAKGEILQFAALRRQADGTWAIVEPDKTLIERTLKP
jgi:hypothetical protein